MPGATLRALAHRDFRLFFAGQAVSLVGTWMQHVAQAWLVYRLTGSSLALGTVAFLANVPVLVLGLAGGVLADRYPRRRLLLIAHGVAAAQAALLAGLTLGGRVEVWHVAALALALGVVHALEMPTRQSFLADLVPRDDLSNAIALNSALFSAARFLGPAAAGVLVARMGEGAVFLLNALSYAAVLVALAAIRVPGGGGTGRGRPALVEGLRFAWRAGPIRAALLLVASVSLFGVPYAVLMPVFADQVLGGGPQTLGLLLGAAGGGSLLGALRMARRRGTSGFGRLVGRAALAAGVALMVLSQVRSTAVALAVLPLLGLGFTTVVAGSNTFIQLHVPDALRGRVMALFSVTFIGMTPVGHLIAGAVAEAAGVPATIALYGAACVLAAAGFGLMLARGGGAA
ncbi:MFS transporter [Inmirania thermothiophila]|uniref:Putative MFS family arabinose efflux permease n=1 Tax=Inmirania thermothiophila TaxID=1750597 RepID=A0A3N1Y864_9GAMM|nr:MFS transporter [Inmirania thermothiophila]ROR35009.1 putative MFS family arabinose efflux permease [Inmirania thermothiophila]